MGQISKTTRAAAAFMLALAPVGAARAELLDRSATLDGVTVQYRVVVPDNFDPAKAYPAVLAFPPGDQEMNLVDGMIAVNFQVEAEKRGYIVISPAAPGGVTFPRGGEVIFPAFLTKLLSEYKIQSNKFNAAGVSNGGLSAFLIASKYPQYFLSVTGLPGYLSGGSPQQAAALGKLCIHMYAGERDMRWVEEESRQSAEYRAAGYNVTFSVEGGEGHVMRSVEGAGSARLFDQFDAARKGKCAK